MDKHLANYKTSGYLWTVLDYDRSQHKLLIWNFKMEAVELKQGFLMKIATIDIPFDLQHLKQSSEFREALFSSHLQAGYHVYCVPDDSWVHCGEVLSQYGQKS